MPKKIGNTSQNSPLLLIMVLGILLLVGVVSCQADQPQEIQNEELTTSETAIIESPEPTAVEVATLAELPAEKVDECLACHIDRQTLIDTAEPVVVLESESSGEG